MEFRPLHYGERIRVINPFGTIGLVTLWSDPDRVISRLRDHGADLSDGSHIAVAGTLYGGGFKHLLRNVLYNPQIDTLLLYGVDLGGAAALVKNFFAKGIMPVPGAVSYAPLDGREITACQVVGSDYFMDDLVRPEMFDPSPSIVHIEDPGRDGAEAAASFLQSYVPSAGSGERLLVPIPRVDRVSYPSDPRGHVIVEDSPVAAWRSLVSRIYRFGERVVLRKGPRLELRNMKVVVRCPEIREDEFTESGIDMDSVRQYQEELLDGAEKPDWRYTYGNRLRGYFERGDGSVIDAIEVASRQLAVSYDAPGGRDANPDARGTFLSLWDPEADLEAESGKPCMTSIFLRKIECRLELTAVYRTHNAMRAWIKNVCGLIAVLEHICRKTGTSPGPVTVFSHSISLDPGELEHAQKIYEQESGKNAFRDDPNGHLTIYVDGDEIVADHWHSGIALGSYRGRKPGALQYELARNHVISEIAHAIYVGMQLEKAYWCIQEGINYVQTDIPGRPGGENREL
jgi:thymidylate synthase